jgi:hypothetical protein
MKTMKTLVFVLLGGLLTALPAMALQSGPSRVDTKEVGKQVASANEAFEKAKKDAQRAAEKLAEAKAVESMTLQQKAAPGLVSDAVAKTKEAEDALKKESEALVEAQIKKLQADEAQQKTTIVEGLSIVNGIEYSTSKSSAGDQLLEQGQYYLEIYYNWQKPFEKLDCLDMGFGLDFRDAYFATTNAPTSSSSNRITQAQAIGITISPKLTFKKAPPLFIRADLGGIMSQSDNKDIDEEFNWECAAVVGLERPWNDEFHFRAEVGAAYYERLPEDTFRSLVRLLYGYKVSSSLKALVSVEFSGIEHNGSEEVRLQMGVEIDPKEIFSAIGKTVNGK